MADRFGYGVKGLVVVKLVKDDGTEPPKYGEQIETGSLNKVKFSRQTANGVAYGDDKKVADITVTTGGTLEITFWGLSQKSSAEMFGHTYNEETGTVEKMSDVAPCLGIGYYRTFQDSTGAKSYDAYIAHKAQGVQGDEEATTSSSDISLSAETIKFNAVEPKLGPFRSVNSFTDEAAANNWIRTNLGLVANG